MKLVFSIAAVLCANGLFAYNFLFTSHDRAAVVLADSDGKIRWSMPADHPQNAEVSPDGKRIFVAEISGARMVDIQSRKTLWRYETPTVKWDGEETDSLKRGQSVRLENPVAQILGADRFLVGNEGRATLLEIDSNSNVLKTVKCESEKRVKHGEFRLARRDSRGRYIFPSLASSLLTVYDAQGRQMRRIRTDGGVVSAQFLPDGRILAGGIFGLAAYDSSDKKVWSFTSGELRAALGADADIVICDARLMPNGNILCTTYCPPSVAGILEVSFDKKIVKKISFDGYSHLSALQLLDGDFKPFPQPE